MLFLLCALVGIGCLVLLAKGRRDMPPPAVLGVSLIALACAAGLVLSCIVMVPAGHVGIVDLFGRVSDRSLQSGLHVVNPLARVVRMSIKTQELKEAMDVPSKEGLPMKIESSLLFHLDPTMAPDVYKTVGANYAEILLEPQFRSVTRGVTALHDAKALYTSEREQIAGQITEDLRALVGPRGILIEGTPLRQLTLPARLAAAIEEKLSAEQESQRMAFVLMRETQEAERKRIEAQGIADFQRIVSQGISDQLLKWKGIEATLEIAKSENAKVVVIGSGPDGLPIILGDR